MFTYNGHYTKNAHYKTDEPKIKMQYPRKSHQCFVCYGYFRRNWSYFRLSCHSYRVSKMIWRTCTFTIRSASKRREEKNFLQGLAKERSVNLKRNTKT